MEAAEGGGGDSGNMWAGGGGGGGGGNTNDGGACTGAPNRGECCGCCAAAAWKGDRNEWKLDACASGGCRWLLGDGKCSRDGDGVGCGGTGVEPNRGCSGEAGSGAATVLLPVPTPLLAPSPRALSS